MATKPIDLEALAKDLRRYWQVEITGTKYGDPYLIVYSGGPGISRMDVDINGKIGFDRSNYLNWPALDIIRRHVSPVADPATPAGLLAAAMAPAEGTVPIARRTESVTSTPIVIPAMLRRHMLDAGNDGLVLQRATINRDVEPFDGDGPCDWGIVLEFVKDPGDLDAVLDPTEPPQAPAQTP